MISTEKKLIQTIDKTKLPRHVAIIMDGNGRWAKGRGLCRIEGHKRGVERSEDIITCAREMGIGYLTLYAFSKENWKRPPEEVEALMVLLKAFLLEKKQKMIQNGICFNTIGNIDLLPDDVQETIQLVKRETKEGRGLVLSLALSYGGRDELLRAVTCMVNESLAQGKLKDGLNEESFGTYLDTRNLPDPDLIIRTSGEYRVSNFLLWQGAYAEYFFTHTLWPDFTEDKFVEAICEYQKRERRFGLVTGDQI